MKAPKVIVLLILLVMATGCVSERESRGMVEQDSTVLDLKGIGSEIFERVNEVRESHGLPPLSWDERLTEAAQMHAEDMARRNYFSHESPEGETFRDRFAKVGYTPRSVSDGKSETIVWGGENLFLYAGPPEESAIVEEAIAGWMNSPGHRENILRREFALTGVGVAYAPTCTYENMTLENCVYIVQTFG
ncbi:CAP domain-containing protein [Palaeococcus ferrophilus]|uniref:CAP domain-containing protein n=1 Tax=Palaeococcus ferrophilus TaxID=83868 RepID=UPI000695FB16|nr:CAP domain-containing protein [Palaeococcus ferrophilus]